MQPREPVLGIGSKYTKNRDAGIGGYLEKLSTFGFRETNSWDKRISWDKLVGQTRFRETNS